MYVETVKPIWQALLNRFQKTVEGLTEEEILRPTDLKRYTQLLADSNAHVMQAMENLPDS